MHATAADASTRYKGEAMKDKVATDIKHRWSEDAECFDCPCGKKEIILGEAGIEKKCDCGRVYKLVHYVAIVEG